jgi:GNAT superfamily N-acetyltransferase
MKGVRVMNAARRETTVGVTLSVPEQINYQLVYRLRRSDPFPAVSVPGYAYHFLAGPGAAWRLRRGIAGHFRSAGFLKTCAKLATRDRTFYCLTAGEQLANYGWVTASHCRYYRIGIGEIVIGPVWTDPRHRGKGLATAGLQSAVNSLIARGYSVFYIDTSKDNLAMQKVIAKCGFGPPVALFWKGKPGGIE